MWTDLPGSGWGRRVEWRKGIQKQNKHNGEGWEDVEQGWEDVERGQEKGINRSRPRGKGERQDKMGGDWG